MFSQRVSTPVFLLALVSQFFGLCRQISLANASLFKRIMFCVSEFLHSLDHPNFLSGTVITILSHCQFFSVFPFLAVESCYEVSEWQCNYCSSFGKLKSEGVCRLENEIRFLVFIFPVLSCELLLSSSSTRALFSDKFWHCRWTSVVCAPQWESTIGKLSRLLWCFSSAMVKSTITVELFTSKNRSGSYLIMVSLSYSPSFVGIFCHLDSSGQVVQSVNTST